MVKRVRRSGGTVHSTVGLPYMAKAQENLNQRVPVVLYHFVRFFVYLGRTSTVGTILENAEA